MLTNSNTVTARTTFKLDYLLVLLLICMSGNSSFDAVDRQKAVLVAVCCLLAALLVRFRKAIPTVTLLVIVSVFSAIFVFQSIIFKFVPLVTILGFFTRLFIGYAVFQLVNEFPKTYTKVIYHICIVSFLFYVPDTLCRAIDIDFRSLFEPLRRLIGVESRFNILFYNFMSDFHIHRNSACFGEPGIFAAYLLLAVMFLGLQKSSYPGKGYRKMLLLLILALLTTFSTTGYVVLPLCLLLHTESTNISVRKVPQLLIVLTLVIAMSVVFYRLDFVGGKIRNQYEETSMQEGNWHLTRIGTFFYDLEYIKQRPFFGWGVYEKTRFALDGGETIEGMGNGLTDFVCKFGLFGLVTWAVFLWKGVLRTANFDRAKTNLFILLVLLLLNGEPLLNYPLVMSLMFLNMNPVGITPAIRYVSYQKRILTPKRNLLIRTNTN